MKEPLESDGPSDLPEYRWLWGYRLPWVILGPGLVGYFGQEAALVCSGWEAVEEVVGAPAPLELLDAWSVG